MTRPLSIGTAYANKTKAGESRPQGKRIYWRCDWCGGLGSLSDATCRHCFREQRGRTA